MNRPRKNASRVERFKYVEWLIEAGCPPSLACQLGYMTLKMAWMHFPDRLRYASAARAVLIGEADQVLQVKAIRALRALGWSWLQIGASWGFTKQRAEELHG